MRHAKERIDTLPEHSLTVFDRGLLSAEILLQVQQTDVQRHWLIPARSNSKREKLDKHPTDYRVRMKVSPQARKALPTLPSHWEARAMEIVSRHGQQRILLTSLLDAKAWPATATQA